MTEESRGVQPVQFLHVLTLFGAVAAALIDEVVLDMVGRTSDVAWLRSFLRVMQTIATLIPVLFTVGASFDFVTAW